MSHLDIQETHLSEDAVYEREVKFGNIVQHLYKSHTLEKILKIACAEVKQALNADQVMVLQLNQTGDRLSVIESTMVDVLAQSNIGSMIDFCHGCHTHYINGAYAISPIHSSKTEPDCLGAALLKLQIESVAIAPIVRPANGRAADLWGLIIATSARQDRQWLKTEAQFLQNIGIQLAIAIEQAHLYAQLQTELSVKKQAELELQKNNEQLMLVNADLVRATQLKDEFLAHLSHELRTPLNAILGTSEILQDELFGALNGRQKKALEGIDRSGKHLLTLINEILDLAKIKSGKLKLKPTVVSVLDLCNDSLAIIKPLALQKNIRLGIQIPGGFSTIVADPLRVQQILVNLLSNAVKFTPMGGTVTLKVDWGLDQDAVFSQPFDPQNRYIKFSVIDTGIGIKSEDLDQLFQSFVQIDSGLNRKYEGTGLGLALVKQLTEMHGGDISVISNMGEGSCFTVKLPYSIAIATSNSLPQSLSLGSNLKSEIKSQPEAIAPLILIADDNADNVETFWQYLHAKGYRLLVATNGQEAINLAYTDRPDLILMDIHMPILDGIEAIRHIRDRLTVPIIALSARAFSGYRLTCLEAGANQYLTKPVNLKQLVASIGRLLV
jgi:signal transduction histidine kinase